MISGPSARAQANVQGTPVWPRTPSLLALWHHSSAQRLVLVTETSCRGLERGQWFECGIHSLGWMMGQAPVGSGGRSPLRAHSRPAWLAGGVLPQEAKAACVRGHSMVACIAKVQATIADTDRQLPEADALCIRSLFRLHRSAGLLAIRRTASAADVSRSVRGCRSGGGGRGMMGGQAGGPARNHPAAPGRQH